MIATTRFGTAAADRLICLVILGALSSHGYSQLPRPLLKQAPDSPFRLGSRPDDVALADVDGDGNLDIVTANSGSNDVTVLLGNGKGNFKPAPGSPIAVLDPVHLVAIGDLNGDRRPDVVLSSHHSNDLPVLLGAGGGRFAPAPGSPSVATRRGAPHNHGLLLHDVNADGRLDIITANQNDDSLSVLLGDGKAGFIPARGSPFAVGRSPYVPAVGDLNGDAHLDIVAPSFFDHSVRVLLGDGRGAFRAAPGGPYRVEAQPYFAGLGDLNGDRKLDLVTTHANISLMTISLGDGGGGFRKAPRSRVDTGRRGWKVRFVDINGDGRMDLITSTEGNAVVVLLGNGKGGVRPAPGSPFAVGRGPWGMAVGDVNGDRKLDVVTANLASDDSTVLLGS